MADKIKVLTVDEDGNMKELEGNDVPEAVLDTIKRLHGDLARDDSQDEPVVSFLTQRDLQMMPPGPETHAMSLRADELAGKILRVMDDSNKERIESGEQVSLLEIVLALVSVCATSITATGAPVDIVMDDLKRWTIGLTKAEGAMQAAEGFMAMHERAQSGGQTH